MATGALAALRFCNVNWISSDLHAYTVSTFLQNEFPNVLRTSNGDAVSVDPIAQPELTSSFTALQALQRDECEVVPECWDYEDQRCDSLGGTTVDVGVRGENALYAPSWLLDENPGLASFPSGYIGSTNLLSNIPADLRIIGVPVGWEVRGTGECFMPDFVTGANANKTYVDSSDLQTQQCSTYMPSHLLSRFVFPQSGAEHLALIQEGVKLRKPILFYGWKPSALTEEDGVRRVTTFGKAPVNLKMVYNSTRINSLFAQGATSTPTGNSSLPTSLLAEVLETRWQLFPENVTTLFGYYRSRASVNLPESDVKRRLASQFAADKFMCERSPIKSAPSCRAVTEAASFKRRTKDPSFPAKIVVWTKMFPIFVDSAITPGSINNYPSCTNDDPANFHPAGRQDLVGYTIDHLYEVFGLLGYDKTDIILRCAESTGKLIEYAAENKADVSVAAITVFKNRIWRVDFSTPYYSTGYKFLIASQPPSLKALPTDFFMRPFSTDVWLALLLFVVIVGTLIGAVEGLAQRKRVEKLEEILTEDVKLLEGEEQCAKQLRRFDAESAEVMIDNELLISKEEKRLLMKAVERTRMEHASAPTPMLERTSTMMGLDVCVPVSSSGTIVRSRTDAAQLREQMKPSSTALVVAEVSDELNGVVHRDRELQSGKTTSKIIVRSIDKLFYLRMQFLIRRRIRTTQNKKR
ncbi:unnamed protein product [Amoebophrya sp. A120]|nr:unnamed protein product [Amoebophrya sp. A120]|eukprot:GSA120T00018476001.1